MSIWITGEGWKRAEGLRPMRVRFEGFKILRVAVLIVKLDMRHLKVGKVKR